MKDVRLWFSKKGRAVYISHLDMMRCMQRALKRAGIPVWYTQGFNPHIYITFSLPLSLGFASDCETMDFRIIQDMPFDEIVSRLAKALPPDIRVLRAAAPLHKPEAITYADYHITLRSQAPEALFTQWERFIAQDTIRSDKKTKKGYREINLKDYIISITAHIRGDCFELTARLLAGNTENLNPLLILEALREYCSAAFTIGSVRRTAVYDSTMNPFE